MPTTPQLIAEKQRLEGLLAFDEAALASLQRSLAAAEARGAGFSQLASLQTQISNRQRSIQLMQRSLANVDRDIAATNSPTTTNPPNPQVPPAPEPAPRPTNTSDTTDFSVEDNASLGYSEPPPAVTADRTLANAEDIGTSPYTAGTEDFIPVSEVQPEPDTGFSPYGEENDIVNPDLFGPDPALFTDEYVQEQDNPFELAQEQDTGFSPYGEEDEPADPVPVRDPFEVDGDPGYGSAETDFEQDNPNIATLEVPDPYEIDGIGLGDTTGGQTDPGDAAIASENAAITQGFAQQAREQQTIAQQRKNPNNGDWRVKLRLAPMANYLYKDPNAATGILQPLAVTDGVVFPYTPTIDTQYRANYSTYDLTHSNYRGYFYQNSYVDAINISALFTAQSTPEANYLLAVIHFFRSVTKMFYGQDAQRGTPPPLTYLSGLGEYQFNEHPCLVSNFSYKLPNDVDYIRAGSPNLNNSVPLTWARSKQSTIGGGLLGNLLGGALTRLSNAGLPKGGISAPPPPPTLGLDRPTYVPTKMEISVTLLPVQSRQQVSKQFSVKQFANGDLLKGGFW